jgi:hypothetical protein
MSAIQLKLIPHQTADGLPYQHLRIHIANSDGIIEPEDLKGLSYQKESSQALGLCLKAEVPFGCTATSSMSVMPLPGSDVLTPAWKGQWW